MIDYDEILDFMEENGLTEQQKISTLLDVILTTLELETESENDEY